MSRALTLVGAVLVLIGLLWIGQGTGIFPYPAESFMISQTRWVYYGAAIAVVGLLIVVFARR